MARRAFGSFMGLLLLATPVAQAAPDESRVRDELRKIYERDEFKTGPSEPSPLAKGLRRAFDWLGDLHSAAPLLFWILAIGCIGLLALLFVYLGVAVRRSAFIRRDSVDELGRQAHRQRLSASLRAEADDQARSGDFTAAVRCLFLSLVYAFDESGRLQFEPALTNREYLLGLMRRPTLEAGLRVFVDVLDVNWYGQRATTAGQYRQCLTLYENLRTG